MVVVMVGGMSTAGCGFVRWFWSLGMVDVRCLVACWSVGSGLVVVLVLVLHRS